MASMVQQHDAEMEEGLLVTFIGRVIPFCIEKQFLHNQYLELMLDKETQLIYQKKKRFTIIVK